MNVNFDDIGGLDNYIDQLKEMVALPLLYPELYQNFNITPPRGVLSMVLLVRVKHLWQER